MSLHSVAQSHRLVTMGGRVFLVTRRTLRPTYLVDHKAPSLTNKLSLKLEPLNGEDPLAFAVIRQSDVVGHIPREIYRHVLWFIKVGGTTQVKLHSTKLYQSPIALKGLELLLDVTFLLLQLSTKY